MGKNNHLFDQIMGQISFTSESFPGQSVVEIIGEQRVLIENHLGVAAYGREKILVKVKFGLLCICGCNLEMMHMTKEQMVICGKIESVALQRRR